MSRDPLLDDALEKLRAAVYVLATHPDEVRFRLLAAAEPLAQVPKDALPPPFRERFDAIWDDLTRRAPHPDYAATPDRPDGITPLVETLRRIQKKTAALIAERIVNLESELSYLDEHRDPGAG